jgi:hypothetical protein
VQEVKLFWNEASIANSDFAELLKFCQSFEVVAHLDVRPDGVRQLARCQMHEGMTVEQLNDVSFLTFEGLLPNRDDGPDPIVVMNRHPLVSAAVIFDDIAVYPPYSISANGISVTVRGVPSGISDFLALTNDLLPPDKVSVTTHDEPKDEARNLLGERQLEVIQKAVAHGYYDEPRKISMRDLSIELNIARSTLGEHLHKAEATLIKWVSENN